MRFDEGFKECAHDFAEAREYGLDPEQHRKQRLARVALPLALPARWRAQPGRAAGQAQLQEARAHRRALVRLQPRSNIPR